MRIQLELNEYIWAVAKEDPNDGRGYHAAHFADQGKADQYARRHGGRVVQVALWKDTGGNTYYHAKLDRVPVDIPERDEVLKKLSPAEREALGIK